MIWLFRSKWCFLPLAPLKWRAVEAQRQKVTRRTVWLCAEWISSHGPALNGWLLLEGIITFSSRHFFPFCGIFYSNHKGMSNCSWMSRMKITSCGHPGLLWVYWPQHILVLATLLALATYTKGYDARTGLGSMLQMQSTVHTLSTHMWSSGCRVPSFHKVLRMSVQGPFIYSDLLHRILRDRGFRSYEKTVLGLDISSVNLPEEDVITNHTHTWFHSAKCSCSYLKNRVFPFWILSQVLFLFPAGHTKLHTDTLVHPWSQFRGTRGIIEILAWFWLICKQFGVHCWEDKHSCLAQGGMWIWNSECKVQGLPRHGKWLHQRRCCVLGELSSLFLPAHPAPVSLPTAMHPPLLSTVL